MQSFENNQSIRQSLIESIQTDDLRELAILLFQWAEKHKAKLYYWAQGAWLAALHRKAQVFLRLDDPPLAFIGRAYEVSPLEAFADIQTWEGKMDGTWYKMLYAKYSAAYRPPELWFPLYYLFATIRPEVGKGETQIVDANGNRYILSFYKDRLIAVEKEAWQPSH